MLSQAETPTPARQSVARNVTRNVGAKK
jgi:hypothetical protein